MRYKQKCCLRIPQRLLKEAARQVSDASWCLLPFFLSPGIKLWLLELWQPSWIMRCPWGWSHGLWMTEQKGPGLWMAVGSPHWPQLTLNFHFLHLKEKYCILHEPLWFVFFYNMYLNLVTISWRGGRGKVGKGGEETLEKKQNKNPTSSKLSLVIRGIAAQQEPTVLNLQEWQSPLRTWVRDLC